MNRKVDLQMVESERFRNSQIKFWTTKEEKSQLNKNMHQAGYATLGNYLLKMGLQGFIIQVDFSSLRGALGDVGNLRMEFNKIGNNINQIAKHTNESHEIDAMDFYLLQEEVGAMRKKMEHFEREVVHSFEQKLKELGVN